MNLFLLNFVTEFAELLTTALMHFVWQGTVLALMLLVIVKMLDVRTARLRYLLSVGTLLAMGLAPCLTIALSQVGTGTPQNAMKASSQSNSIVEQRSTVSMAEHPGADFQKVPTAPFNHNVQFYVLIAWLAGVSFLSTRLVIGYGMTLWIRSNVRPLSKEFELRVRTLGNRLGVDAGNRVFTCVRVGQAAAVGFIRPVVLVPAAWLAQLTPEMLEAVIAHELAHIRRWDLWINLSQRVIETLLFFHPAVWWLSSRIRLEREMCCDEIAAGCFDKAMYARSLESVARIAHGNLLMAASINGGKKMNLLSRIRYLLGVAPIDATGNWWAVGFLSVILPVAAVVAFSLTAGSAPSVAMADEHLDESKAIEKIELLGGKVMTDDNLPGNSVVDISFGDTDDRFNEKHMYLLKGFKHLTQLNLWNVRITDESLKELRDLKKLEVLDLSYTKAINPSFTRITDAGLKELTGLKHIRSLNLWQARITDKGLKELSELKELTDLNLTATKITDAGLKELKVLKNLTTLNLGSNQTSGITDAGLKELSELNGLTDLDLKATRITDAGLKELRALKNLKSLDLSFNRITGTGLKELGDLEHLTDLNLEHCLVSDAGLKDIGKLQSLRSLKLSFCQITDTGINELSELNNLTELNLTKTQVTSAGIQELRKSLPNVKIIHGGTELQVIDEQSNDNSDESKAPAAEAAGLRTKFGEVVIRNLKIGQTYSLYKLLNMPLRVVNSGDETADLKIDVIGVPAGGGREGYTPIPDLSWVTLEKHDFTVEPNKEAVTDIIISLPNDPKLLGRRFEADIWSRTTGRKSMFAVGLQSKLLIHVDPTPPSEEELKKKFVDRRIANLDFTLHPSEGLAEDVPLGREFDLKERKLSLKLVNPNDEPLHFKLRPMGGWETLLARIDGFADPIDPNWLKPAKDLIELPGNSVKEVGMTLNIPDDDRYRGQSYFFVMAVEVLEQEIPARAYYKLYVKTRPKQTR